MATFLNLVMLEKEMFLKKINKIYLISFLISTIFICQNLLAEVIKKDILNYLNNIDEFESEFIQSDENSIEEGFLYLKNKRIKIQYISPSKIQIIISKNKGMYFNQDLEEVEYFSTKNSIAEYFYKIFFNKHFFENASFRVEKSFLILEKNILIEDVKSNIKIFFENNPILIRKLQIKQNDSTTTYSVINPNFNPELNKKFFSMVNPLIN